MNYIKSVGKEMKNVSWPSVKEVNRFTWISIFFIIAFGLYFGLTDEIFSTLLEMFFNA